MLFDDRQQDKIYIHACQNIKEGEEITISYIDGSALTYHGRRDQLHDDYGFFCSCPLCQSGAVERTQSDKNRSMLAEVHAITQAYLSRFGKDVTSGPDDFILADEFVNAEDLHRPAQVGDELAILMRNTHHHPRTILGALPLHLKVPESGTVSFILLMHRLSVLVIELCEMEGSADGHVYFAYRMIARWACLYAETHQFSVLATAFWCELVQDFKSSIGDQHVGLEARMLDVCHQEAPNQSIEDLDGELEKMTWDKALEHEQNFLDETGDPQMQYVVELQSDDEVSSIDGGGTERSAETRPDKVEYPCGIPQDEGN